MITVLGGTGFVGSHIIKTLKERQIPYYVPLRDEDLRGKELGDVIYCIGLTADFRVKPFETVEAHVCKLTNILNQCNFKSITYLSSTRVYIRCTGEEVSESAPIQIDISDPDELYTLTKLTGERICLSSGKKTKVVRLSNVIGDDRLSDNFITNIIKQIKSTSTALFYTGPNSSKDYIPVDIASDLLIKIATSSGQGIYNLAAGVNLSNQLLIEQLKAHFKFEFSFAENGKEIVFPRINVDRISNEFGYQPSLHIDKLTEIIKNYTNDTN